MLFGLCLFEVFVCCYDFVVVYNLQAVVCDLFILLFRFVVLFVCLLLLFCCFLVFLLFCFCWGLCGTGSVIVVVV